MTVDRTIVLLLAVTLLNAAALAPSAPPAAGQSARRIDDAQVKRSIAGRILDARASFFSDIEVDVVAGDILLTGRVGSPQDKLRAVALVRSVSGVRKVVNEIRVGKNGDIESMANDLDIEKRVGQALRAFFKKEMPRVAWRASDGVVHIFGRARSKWERKITLAVIRKTPGIKKIVDHLRIVRE